MHIHIQSWQTGRPAAFDITMTALLQTKLFQTTALIADHALEAAEERNMKTIVQKEAFILFYMQLIFARALIALKKNQPMKGEYWF